MSHQLDNKQYLCHSVELLLIWRQTLMERCRFYRICKIKTY